MDLREVGSRMSKRKGKVWRKKVGNLWVFECEDDVLYLTDVIEEDEMHSTTTRQFTEK